MKKILVSEAILIHDQLINETGGSQGTCDEDLLDSALMSPFQTFDEIELYPSIPEKAAQLCYFMINNHPFVDGNKRAGIHIMLIFLELNHYSIKYSQQQLIDLGMGVASGKMDALYIYNWIIANSQL